MRVRYRNAVLRARFWANSPSLHPVKADLFASAATDFCSKRWRYNGAGICFGLLVGVDGLSAEKESQSLIIV